MYYGEVREPPDKAGAVGPWSCPWFAANWLGCQNVPRRASATADAGTSENIKCTKLILKRQLAESERKTRATSAMHISSYVKRLTTPKKASAKTAEAASTSRARN